MGRRLARIVSVVVCAAGLAPANAHAQAARLTPANSGTGWCFEPEPQPTCEGFWITELNGYHALAASQFTEQAAAGQLTRRDLREHFSVSVGAMANHGPSAAFGAAVMLGNGPEGERVGVEARARRWFGAAGAIDVSAGPLQAMVRAPSSSGRARGLGGGADVSLMWFDWVGLTVRGEALRAEGRTVHAFYAGARLGSYPAIVVTAGIGVLLSILSLSHT